jgi:hypothetical protein
LTIASPLGSAEWFAMDIGPQTIDHFSAVLRQAKVGAFTIGAIFSSRVICPFPINVFQTFDQRAQQWAFWKYQYRRTNGRRMDPYFDIYVDAEKGGVHTIVRPNIDRALDKC